MPTFKIEKFVSDQFMMDVLTNMVECGDSGYWAAFKNIQRDEAQNIYAFEVFEHNEEIVDFDSPNDWETVTLQSLHAEIQKVLELQGDQGYVVQYIRDGVMDEEAGMFDGEACDYLLQMIVLDSIVYG